MSKPLKALIVEDSEDDTLLLVHALQRGGYDPIFERVETAAAMTAALKKQAWDIIFSDYSMPRFSGRESLKLLQQSGLDLPFIIISGTIGEDVAVATMKAGANDYLMKNNLIRLGPAIERELHDARVRQQRRQAEYDLDKRMKELSCLYSISKLAEGQDASLEEIVQAAINFIPPAWQYPEITCARLILEGKELTTKNFRDTTWKQASNLIMYGERIGTLEVYYLEEKPESDEGPFLKEERSLINAIVKQLGKIIERRQAEEALQKSEKRYRTLFENSKDAIYINTREGKFVDANQSFLDLFGYNSSQEIIALGFKDLYFNLNDRTRFQREIEQKGSVKGYELNLKKKDGEKIECLVSATLRLADDGSILGYQGIIRDVTDRKKLEEQFRQAQKMEAIGVLAGGVAHDFNNLLTVIIGNAQLALMKVIKDESLRKGIEETKKAGERAASLTRQLLAFSRKQIIKPEVLDINEVINETKKMLRRMIGEDIEFQTVLGLELWKIYADLGQIDQIIMNLAVNAKDAMPMGGKFTIKTANMDLDESYFHKHGIEKKKPGHYVMLTVSDTGIGMDKKTREHIFEPFFTTKKVGKGTGLGLSTVYGIVKQNNGFVWVCSEPEQGSTFKICLPKAKRDVASEKKEQLPVAELGGSETVFIVEDDDNLRKLTRTVLKRKGYKILEAENGKDALRISEAHEGRIDLMITDVVMPKIGGKELAERLQPLYPQMKVIYMSGYTDDAIVQHGVLEPGLNFLEKPFTPEGLTHKVREVLDD